MGNLWSSHFATATWMSQLSARLPWIVLGGGVLALSIALVVLMVSKWGQARPLAKCVALSVWAHVVLLSYAYLMRMFDAPAFSGPQRGVSVRMIDELVDDRPEDESLGRPTEVPEMEIYEPQLARDVLPDSPATQRDLQTRSLDESLPEPGVLNGAQFLVEPPPNSQPPEPPIAAAEPMPSTPEPMRPTARDDTEVVAPMPDLDRAGTSNEPSPERMVDSDSLDESHPPLDVPSLDAVPLELAEADVIASAAERVEVEATAPDQAPSPPTESVAVVANASTSPWHQAALQRASSTVYGGRLRDEHLQLALEFGGSEATERAVQQALQWLASAQNLADGRWDTLTWDGGHETREFAGQHVASGGMRADTAITGLALLAFLAGGNTHLDGPYQETVDRGLKFLQQSQDPQTGSLAGDAGRYVAMYCHGIASLAISEAYILTGDPSLRLTLEKGIAYTIRSQHRSSGGWRYQPGDYGDTSQFGWQLMALASARSAGIEIPETTWQGAARWLERVSLGQHRGLACYTPDRRVASHTMTAEAMACRLFMDGGQDRRAIEEGASFISREGLGGEPMNLYYYYYGTLALFQLQDHRWVSWNRQLSERLISSQVTSGQLAGSWSPDTVWGRSGGRVYSTALACLCLETYYRYLPFYQGRYTTATNPQPYR